MKVTKTVTMDLELAQRLSKEENASKLISDLLKNHYSKDESSKAV